MQSSLIQSDLFYSDPYAKDSFTLEIRCESYIFKFGIKVQLIFVRGSTTKFFNFMRTGWWFLILKLRRQIVLS